MDYISFILTLAAILQLSSTCSDVSAPQTSLLQLHPCDSARVYHGNCFAAYHRYCNKVTFPTARATVGVSREHANGVVGLSCIQAHWKGDVTIAELSQHHPSCNTWEKNQHRDCLSAIHGYCRNRFGSEFAGISQEVGGSFFNVGCFRSASKESVPISVMTSLHGGCRLNSYSAECFAAASRFCVRFHGHSGGITVEVGNGEITVACYKADYSGDAFLTRSAGYYRARSQAVEVCSLELNTTEGVIVDSGAEVLGRVAYDNSESNLPLNPTFEVSRYVVETSRFQYPASPTILPQAFISTKIPSVSSGSISLSPSITTTFGRSGETSITKTYHHSSEVEIKASTKIIKEVSITRASLEVPWTAKVRTGLGSIKEISGMWHGESTYDLQIAQKNY